MRRFRTLALVAACLLTAESAYTTWSVIAVDRASGTMVSSLTDQDITLQEDANPVRTLRMRCERWKKLL